VFKLGHWGTHSMLIYEKLNRVGHSNFTSGLKKNPRSCKNCRPLQTLSYVVFKLPMKSVQNIRINSYKFDIIN
jgi:hypothetical protein